MTRERRGRCRGDAALLAALPPRRPAAPSEAEREARAHFQTGEARFKAGAYDEALAEYQAGYDAKPLPGFLINIAQCQRRLGDLKTARATYQKFVLVAPDSPLVPQVESMIAEIDGLLDEARGRASRAPGDEEAKPAARRPAARRGPSPPPPAPVLVAAAPSPASERPRPSAASALVAVGRAGRRRRRRRGDGGRARRPAATPRPSTTARSATLRR